MYVLLLVLFLVMSLQMVMGYFQVKTYRKEMGKLRGTGIVGLGHTKAGWTKKGKILILSYKPSLDRVISCKVMKGITVFAKFKDVHDYDGMTFEEVHQKGLEEDAAEFKYRRKKHPYDAGEYSKKKGALIQAIEAIEGRMERERNQSENPVDLHGEAMKQAEAKKSGQLEGPLQSQV